MDGPKLSLGPTYLTRIVTNEAGPVEFSTEYDLNSQSPATVVPVGFASGGEQVQVTYLRVGRGNLRGSELVWDEGLLAPVTASTTTPATMSRTATWRASDLPAASR